MQLARQSVPLVMLAFTRTLDQRHVPNVLLALTLMQLALQIVPNVKSAIIRTLDHWHVLRVLPALTRI